MSAGPHSHRDAGTIADIAVEGLGKRFGDVEAVGGISFTVGKGVLFGFLGPNGAGKTTIINLHTGLARPDAGKIKVGGIDCTGREERRSRARERLDAFGLAEAGHRPGGGDHARGKREKRGGQ